MGILASGTYEILRYLQDFSVEYSDSGCAECTLQTMQQTLRGKESITFLGNWDAAGSMFRKTLEACSQVDKFPENRR